eukprot:snap_masked-scaffold_92-processed-gene-0.16-mRNA-1 protein AED:1.00 eAED:1.00 QI:0/0/0/0/1/1/5/0/115
MSFKTPSIKQQFNNRNQSNQSYDRNINPTERERFRKEAEEFVKKVNVHEEIMTLTFDCCPLDFIGKNLSIWFEKFPKVKVYILSFKQIEFYWNEKNKTKIKYSGTRFYWVQYSKR